MKVSDLMDTTVSAVSEQPGWAVFLEGLGLLALWGALDIYWFNSADSTWMAFAWCGVNLAVWALLGHAALREAVDGHGAWMVPAMICACLLAFSAIVTFLVILNVAGAFEGRERWVSECRQQGGNVVNGGKYGDDLCVLPDGRIASWR